MPRSHSTETTQYATLPPRCSELPPRRRRRIEIESAVIEERPRNRRNERGERMLTVARLYGRRAALPMIRIRGAWLRKLGFAIGARIVVSEERGRIVLTVEQEEAMRR